MVKIRRSALLILCIAASIAGARAQQAQQAGEPPKAAVKTNLLYGAGTLTPNLGVEFGLGGKTTLDLGGGYNPWNLNGSETNNKKLVHWLVQPEFRYWLKERFEGHFFGVHALGGQYNVGGHNIPILDFKKQFRYEGYIVGSGVSYGYLWNWNHRLGAEFTVGVGAAHLNYDKYDCAKCGEKVGNFSKTYFGPTKAGITLVYKIGVRKKPAVPATVPVYTPPVVSTVVSEPQPEPRIQPEPEPTPVPQPTTAERLAATHAFLAPIAELGDEFSTDPDRYVAEHREGSLSVYFRQGAKVIDRSYKNNGATIDKLLSTVREIENSTDSRVVWVVIAGFASPEGSSELNDRLAHDRAVTIKGYLVENTTLTNGMVDIHNGGIDWAGLRRLVAESDMYEKTQVLIIIDNTPIWDARRNVGRHGELMRLQRGEPYRYMLREFFPDLRNATYIRVYYENKVK